MDKSINIEVLLKAAEYIEQINNKGKFQPLMLKKFFTF